MPTYATYRKKFFVGALCFAFSSLAVAAQLFSSPSPAVKSTFSEPAFLPVDQAFQLSVSADNEMLRLNWHIAEGYYLYQHRITLVTEGENRSKILLQFPPGVNKVDEYFGEITAFYEGLELLTPLPVNSSNGQSSPSLLLIYQGCADAGLCYPPQKLTITRQAGGNILLSKTH